jgi:hypothetical protein
MSQDSRRNSAVNSAAGTKVHHAKFEDIKQFTPEKVNHLKRGGIRSGSGRTDFEAQQMLDKIPPSRRFGTDRQSSALNVKEHLLDKDASHITSHNRGGSSDPNNMTWENKSLNRSRGDRNMTSQEQRQIAKQARVDNVNGAVQAGLKAAPRGAIIGVITTAPFAMLRNALSVVRGEMSTTEAVEATVKETAIGAGVGAVTAFTVTTVASACPPIAIALSSVSPALLVVGGAGMVYEFFKILDDHKQETKKYYESLTQQDLARLKYLEEEIEYEYQKHLDFLEESKSFREQLQSRPVESTLEGALNRYRESAALAQSIGVEPCGKNLLDSIPQYNLTTSK